MKWFKGFLKIILIVSITAFAANYFFVYKSGVNPLKVVYERIGFSKTPGTNENQGNTISDESTKKSETDKIQQSSPSPTGILENDNKVIRQEQPEKNKKSANNDEYFLTFNEIQSIENISVPDKLTGLSMLSKLKKEDIDRIFEIIDNGITNNEYKELKHIMGERLSSEELKKLEDILVKNKKLYAEGKLK